MKIIYSFIIAFIASTLIIHSQTYTGVASYFDNTGTPYGACGVPPDKMESDNYVALNVFNQANIGSGDWIRPITGDDLKYMGEFANGLNCGRWVKVTLGANCIDGLNDGKLGEEFCRGENAKWVDDKYSGAELYMIVTDACGDNNGWCRESSFHLDLHTSSLNRFVKDGVKVGDLYPNHWNNRKISWEYVKSPNYSGDIEIYFLHEANKYWPAIVVGHLENGIHTIEQKVDGNWVLVQRNSDMGQAFILQAASEFTIRITDAEDKYINNGREYTFTLPVGCEEKCQEITTKAEYTINNPDNDCDSSPLIPNFQVNDGEWIENSIITISPDSKVVLAPKPEEGGSWSWEGLGTNGTDRIQTIYPQNSGEVIATYTNECNSKSQIRFKLTVKGGSGELCSDPILEELPIDFTGEGEFCWITSVKPDFVNSWGADKVEINGVDYTNTYVSDFPNKINGNYYIKYKATIEWAHIEVISVKENLKTSSNNLKYKVLVFPNPLNGKTLEIVVNKEFINSKIKIYDIHGKLIHSEIIYKDHTLIDKKIFNSKGLYIVNVLGRNKTLNYKIDVN